MISNILNDNNIKKFSKDLKINILEAEDGFKNLIKNSYILYRYFKNTGHDINYFYLYSLGAGEYFSGYEDINILEIGTAWGSGTHAIKNGFCKNIKNVSILTVDINTIPVDHQDDFKKKYGI